MVHHNSQPSNVYYKDWHDFFGIPTNPAQTQVTPLSNTMPTQDTATKHDQLKPDLSLLSSVAILELAKVLDFGAKKYAEHNWRKGFTLNRPYSAAMRHMLAWNAGETTDPESGLNHLAHAMCNLMFLLELQQTRPELDNRYKKDV